MASKSRQRLPPDFVPLGVNSSLYTPSTSTTATDSQRSLVILCSWMGASPKNIAKYTNTYRVILPNASILLIQCEVLDMTWRSFESQRRNMLPTVSFVESFLESSSRTSGSEYSTSDALLSRNVILHIFSHGGGNTAMRFLRGIAESGRVKTPLPLRAFILDSTPGDDGYSRAIAAVRVGAPKNPILLFAFLLLAHFTLILQIAMIKLRLTRGIVDMRRAMIEEEFFDRKTPRLYIYSKADLMIDYKAVEKHAEEAKQVGYTVQSTRFESSPHCGHIIEDEDRYWDAVKDVAMIG